MATTQTRFQPTFVRSDYHVPATFVGGPEETWCKETASQTYGTGDLLYVDSSGTIAICTNSGNKLNSAIAGVSAKAATGVTGAQVHMHVIRPDETWLMNVYHGTLASAISAQAQLGVRYGIILNGGKWAVDIENTTIEDTTTALGRVKVVGFPTYSPDGVRCSIGDTYGLVLVKFLQFSIATDGSPATYSLQLA